ncbi:MAG: adenylyltransferase/cytidyltransferase family protein [Candidatus Peribacteraceae bacterium]|nr:adenylyltransferase/cytidyltransferase family protein [Candidatus Peribacteraceae bacterium]MDD5074733.1 adenylyltransferase/cytidyltransferase family protein [Candidatus Peribacteraceae bacterium]
MNILVFGTFDRLHPGHVFLLTEAGKRGTLTVVVARDENVRRIKGRSPVQNETERAEEIRRVFPQANVILGDSEDYLRPVHEQKPDLILLGYDQQLPPGVVEEDLLCPVERLPAHEPDTFKSSVRRANS